MRSALVALGMLALILTTACTTDKERIAAQNEAARTQTPEARSDFGRASVFELRAGDCITEESAMSEGEETESVEVVRCDDEDAAARVTKLHLIPAGDDAPYPGDEESIALAEEVCATATPYTYLTPVRESWVQGDRTITCIEFLGFNYAVGSCIGPEEDGHLVVPCTRSDVFGDVTGLIDVSDQYAPDAPFPPQDVLDGIVERDCALEDDYYLFPSEDTWAAGDRLMICVTTR
jgi:hypothetical protein